MRITLGLLLTTSLWVLPATAQTVQVDAAPWSPGGGPVRVAPTDLGQTPSAQKQAPLRKAHSHLHPGDAQRRQDERDLADGLAAQSLSNAEAAQMTQKLQREILNQQYSNEMRADQAERDRAALQMQLTQPQPIFIVPPGVIPKR
ncbi:hypothetical protein [Roseiterribacter gracilis]|uniref:Uncharacterized protein n=1 Tax=Roseiterribacter gracilis TaxID=2812848 RepID=A0A8S8XCU6_9PROT|nr:hypothetical protein TMPK1_35300 [Rhodospirillales bacterium TMPK1]